MSATPTPASLTNDGEALVIAWSDGVTHRLPWRVLRELCPCASCRAERARPPEPAPLLPVLNPAEAQPLRPRSVRPLGNYAYGIEFSDGHSTGIYTLEFLRELGEQTAER